MKKILLVCGLLLGVSFATTSSEVIELYSEKIREIPNGESYEIFKEYNELKDQPLITIAKDNLVFAIEQDMDKKAKVIAVMMPLDQEVTADQMLIDIRVISFFLATLSGNAHSDSLIFEAILSQIEASMKTGLETAFFIDNVMYKVRSSPGLITISARNV
ncbi:hypothetical protein DC081_09010 [Ignatzschineria cameli]|uniref:hypothetical protein n=1 Tax=Ignatzschineria cameli TaxID=2182793 RepID=UPI000D6159BA|nr:hypothetical protein [Ignatzschineria cameli]PWD89579.1 hypothetical protein DC081_09010 [Ignatzschineria cameli]